MLFKGQFNTKSAGLYNTRPVTKKEVSWADAIVVMEEEQRSEIARRFPQEYIQTRILCLDIPDTFSYNDEKLVMLIESKMREHLGLLM